MKFSQFTLRNISFKQRFLAANLLMVIIPVCLLLLIGTTVFATFKILGPAKQTQLAMLWPEKGPALLQQYAFNTLKDRADKKDNLKDKDVREESKILESQGLRVAVFSKRRIVYSTPGTNLQELLTQVKGKEIVNVLRWDEDNLTFKYQSAKGNVVWVVGNVPFLAQGIGKDNDWHEILETLFYLVIGLGVIVIILLGRYLARLLSRQILIPLAELNNAAGQIGTGNLDSPLKVKAQGEMGVTCLAFEQMRQQLKEAKNTQKKYEQNRKELLAGISHDLSTPLTAIKGYTSGIAEGVANTPEKQQRYTDRILQATVTMEKLVSELFLFSKLDLERVDFKTEAIDLGEYFKQYVEENFQPLSEQGMHLTLADDTQGAKANIDVLQWQRVVENLLGNSLKYKKGDTVEVKITLTKEKAKFQDGGGKSDISKIKIAFADNGQGVDEKDLPKLFDSFYRTDKARGNVSKGSGLGLAIVRKITKHLQGEIWAEKSLEGGLNVCIVLPEANFN